MHESGESAYFPHRVGILLAAGIDLVGVLSVDKSMRIGSGWNPKMWKRAGFPSKAVLLCSLCQPGFSSVKLH